MEQKNAILASAKGSAHASFTVLTVNVLGSFFNLEMYSFMFLNTSSALSKTLTFSTHLTEQNLIEPEPSNLLDNVTRQIREGKHLN